MNSRAHAFTQSDWSGGVGTDTSSQYESSYGVDTSTPNQLTLDGSTYPDWCDTATCNTDWTVRKPVMAYASSQVTDRQVNVQVTHEPEMRSDFGDLRFVSPDGSTDYNYYFASKVDDIYVDVVVSIPTVPDTNSVVAQMYYGNSSATSLSDDSMLLFQDGFRANGTNPVYSQIDPEINFNWSYESPDPQIPNDNFGARWTGTITAPVTESYTFTLCSDDGSSLHIDDVLIIDNPGTNCTEGDIDLTASTPYDIRVEYREVTGVATASFFWRSNSLGGNQIVPSSVLSAIDPDTDLPTAGLLGDYYTTTDLTTGSGLGAQWESTDPENYYIVGDTFHSSAPMEQFSMANLTDPALDRSVDRTFEFEVENNMGGVADCNIPTDIFELHPTAAITYTISTFSYCGQSSYWNVVPEAGLFMNPGSFLRIRYTVATNGDVTYAYLYGTDWISFGGTTSGSDQIQFSISKPGSVVSDSDFSLKNVIAYNSAPGIVVSLTSPEFVTHQVGNLTSAIIHAGTHPVYDTVNIGNAGTGDLHIRIRSSQNSDMSGAADFDVCEQLTSGALITDSSCVTDQDPYIQYKLEMSGDEGSDLTVSSVQLDFLDDLTPPTNASSLVIKTSPSGSVITEGASNPDGTPYFSWTAGSDADSDFGGYCFYFGDQADGDPVLTGGLIDAAELSPGDTCAGPATGNTHLDIGLQYPSLILQSDTTYYLNIKAYDSFHNITSTSVSTHYTYAPDTTAPTNASDILVKTGSSGTTIADNDWSNDTTPYYSWTAGSDGGSGLAGYCLYFGTSSSGDPVSSKGLITDSSPLTTGGACQYAISGTSLDLGSINDNLPSIGEHVYLIIKALDNAGNVSSSSLVSTSYRFDNSAPSVSTVFSLPDGVVNTKAFSFNWLTSAGTGMSDDGSGAAGFKYCVTNLAIGFGGCTPNDNNWYGLDHGSGQPFDTSDVIPFSAGGYTLRDVDFDRMDDSVYGINMIVLVVIDNAHNYTQVGLSNSGVVVISHAAPTSPTNLVATPSSSSSNAFSFTWDEPDTFIGPANQVDYCWSVNVVINAGATNCTWTGPGITSLASGPYATHQGTNTLYLMAKDQTTNFDADSATSVTFTANTTAPGVPLNLDVTDVSIRATSTWKLAMSWSAPTDPGSGIASYKVYRSTDGTTFSQVGSTSSSNLSFIDSGLSQVLYYYEVKACDNAGACSVASNIASKRPTGRFTTPPHLTADTNQPNVTNITPSKATISWFTDRESDSKIAFGTSPGEYQHEETSNSDQVTNHKVTVAHLQPNTKYYYIARWTDQDGNTGNSEERSFTTQPSPTLSDVTTGKITVSGGTVNFTVKNSSRAVLSYGQSAGLGAAQAINTSSDTSSYSLNLNDLQDGTKYFFRITLYDADSNQYDGDIFSFSTLARPRISNLRFQPVDGAPSSTQKITWNTNVPTNSRISYGPKNGKTLEALDSTLVTEHSLTIADLEDDSDYTLTAQSVDGSGNAAISDTQTFRTALDTRPPKILDVSVESAVTGTGSEARGQIIVSWKTDEPSTSQVAFGQGQSGNYTGFSAEDSRMVTEHVVIVSDLPTSMVYHVAAQSHDKAKNLASSDNQSAIIGQASQSVFTIILNALYNVFGYGG